MSLFARLFGYWEPPAGWQRVRDETWYAELRHPDLGTLTFTQQQGFDAIPVHVEWTFPPGGRAAILAARLGAKNRPVLESFCPPGYRVRHLRTGESSCAWDLEEVSFTELARDLFDHLFGH